MSTHRNVKKSDGRRNGLVLGYCRVSTEQQADTGVSLASQADKVGTLAKLKDLVLSEMLTDAGRSAKNTDRPGLQRLLAMVDAGQVQTVIIAKLDRLTRSVRDLADLLERFEAHNVALLSVAESLDTSSAAGRMVLNIMVSVSQWEREAIGERTATALQHKKSHGQVYNHVPYGYVRHGDALVAVAEEQAVIARIRRARDSGATLREIAAELNAEGLLSKRGGQWSPKTIKDMLDKH